MVKFIYSGFKDVLMVIRLKSIFGIEDYFGFKVEICNMAWLSKNCTDEKVLIEYKNYSMLFTMASLSFDNLSSEHFGFWFPIKLKLFPSTIHYKSGMGKNAVFVLETLQQLDVDEGLSRVLVLCHTRVLAFQISQEYEGFQKYLL